MTFKKNLRYGIDDVDCCTGFISIREIDQLIFFPSRIIEPNDFSAYKRKAANLKSASFRMTTDHAWKVQRIDLTFYCKTCFAIMRIVETDETLKLPTSMLKRNVFWIRFVMQRSIQIFKCQKIVRRKRYSMLSTICIRILFKPAIMKCRISK